jgi:hypothetical protein
LVELHHVGPAHPDVDRLVTEALVGCIRLLSGLLLEAL